MNKENYLNQLRKLWIVIKKDLLVNLNNYKIFLLESYKKISNAIDDIYDTNINIEKIKNKNIINLYHSFINDYNSLDNRDIFIEKYNNKNIKKIYINTLNEKEINILIDNFSINNKDFFNNTIKIFKLIDSININKDLSLNKSIKNLRLDFYNDFNNSIDIVYNEKINNIIQRSNKLLEIIENYAKNI